MDETFSKIVKLFIRLTEALTTFFQNKILLVPNRIIPLQLKQDHPVAAAVLTRKVLNNARQKWHLLLSYPGFNFVSCHPVSYCC